MQGQKDPLQIRIWPSSRLVGVSEVHFVLLSHDQCASRRVRTAFSFAAGELIRYAGHIVVTRLEN